jgi:creatinine amidohydrolase
MYPREIRTAIERNTPVVMAVGVLEYHGEHLNVGVDTLLVTRTLDRLEREDEQKLVILPPFYYGAGSYVVAPPDGNGTMHTSPDGLVPFAREFFRSLLRIGFRNVHLFIHHQSENFAAGMPTDLSFKLAAKQETFAFLEEERGEDWWGREAGKDYYEDNQGGENPFNWIQVHPLMSEAAQAAYPIDHAGRQETSLMMALCPEGVAPERIDDALWYSTAAREASAEEGETAVSLLMADVRALLGMAPV